MGARTVLAVDPGTHKCGLALVSAPPTTVLQRSIVPRAELIGAIEQILASLAPIPRLIVGDGTGSRTVAEELIAAFPGAALSLVDEYATSEEARRRYCRETPARGWRKLLPVGLRMPEEAYDDFVAVILAERWLAEHSG